MAAGGGGPGIVNLGLNATTFVTQLNTAINATANFNTVIGSLNVQLNQFNGTATNAGAGIGNLNAQLTALAGLGAAQAILQLQQRLSAATQEAAAFSRSIGLIQTITADSGLSFDQWADGIRKVSDQLGLPLAETSAAAYDLLSNQVTKAADTFDTLAAAGNLAKITNSSVQDSVNSLSSVINAYGYSSRDTEVLAAKLFTTVDLGRVKLSELESQIGRVAETGKAVGISFEEMNASLIAITNTGVKTNTAMTLLVNLEQKLLKPTKDLQALYDELGVGTGDVFIKTNGLAGALEIIRQKTGGSSAAVAKYFNEIRGNQAYNILTDQMDAFKRGLTEQDTALERSRAALDSYNKTPGAKFQRESQQFQNELTTGFKTQLLETAIAVTDKFGGLKETMSKLLEITGLIGGGIIGWQTALIAGRVAAAGLAGTLGPLLLPVAAGTAGVVIMNEILEWQKAREAAASYYDSIIEMNREANEKNVAADDKARGVEIDALKKSLDERQKLLLEDVVKERKALSTIGDGLQESADTIRESLKNAVELALKSAKDNLREIEARLAKALSNVSAAQKAQREVAGNRGDSLFNFRRTQDQVETGGANEQAILQQRLNQLSREMSAAAKRGDKEGYDKAFSKSEGILNEAANATDANGNLKYFGQVSAINELYDHQLAQLKQIEAVNQRNAQILAGQKASLQSDLKEAEDAGKAIFQFDVKKKDGSDRFNSVEELDAAGAKALARFDAAAARVNANPAAGGDLRGSNAILARGALQQRINDAHNQFVGAQPTFRGQQTNLQDRRQLETNVASIERVANAAIKAINDTAEEAKKKGFELGERKGITDAATKNLAQEPNIFPEGLEGVSTKEEMEALAAEQKRKADAVNEAAARGQYQDVTTTDAAGKKTVQKGAFSLLNDLETFLKRFSTFTQPVMTSGRRDQNQELIDKTPQQAVRSTREALAYQEQANTKALVANMAYAEASNAAPAAFDKINQAMIEWKSLDGLAGGVSADRVHSAISTMSEEIDSFMAIFKKLKADTTESNAIVNDQTNAKVNQELKANDSKGGFAGYFASGGDTRGTDTMLARVDPHEFIMNAQASARFKSQLTAMNQGHDPGSRGGDHTNVGDIHVNVHGGGTSQATINEIAAGLQRGIRQGQSDSGDNMFIQVVPFRERATATMVRPRGLVDSPGPTGLVHYELLRGGRILVPKTLAFNAVNNFAKNAFLDGWFNNGTRGDAYYIGLVDASGFSAFNATDVIGAHSGWGEFTNYTVSGSGTVRATWGYGSATAQAVTNSSPGVFDFTGSGSVQGILITGDPTKLGTGVLLWSTAAFAAPLAVTTGDQLRVTYTVQL